MLNCVFSFTNNATPPLFLLVLELFIELYPSIVYKLDIDELNHVSVNFFMENEKFDALMYD